MLIHRIWIRDKINSKNTNKIYNSSLVKNLTHPWRCTHKFQSEFEPATAKIQISMRVYTVFNQIERMRIVMTVFDQTERMRNIINVPAGTWRKNDVVLTSMRGDYVASTLIRRHVGTKCSLRGLFDHPDWMYVEVLVRSNTLSFCENSQFFFQTQSLFMFI